MKTDKTTNTSVQVWAVSYFFLLLPFSLFFFLLAIVQRCYARPCAELWRAKKKRSLKDIFLIFCQIWPWVERVVFG